MASGNPTKESVVLCKQAVAHGLLELTYMIVVYLVAVVSAVAVPAVLLGVSQVLETWEEKLKTVSEILATVTPLVCPQVVGLWVDQDSSKVMIQRFFVPS
jgi:hypothetical protein